MMSGILVLVEHRQGQLRPVSLEVLGAAVLAKQASGEPVTAAVLGTDPGAFADALKLTGVDEIVTVQTVSNDFDPDTYEAVARALIQRDGDAWLATRSGYGQKVNMEIEFPGKATVVVTLRPGSFKAPDTGGAASVSAFAAPAVTQRSTHVAFKEPAASGDVDIAGADFILSIGRGIGEETHVEQFKELAGAVGATLGCSRPIADSGWLPKAHQVGQSGKTAASCKVYIAMGISGSVQHMAGMKHVENIIAVNTDPEASIFTIAKYGIVGDIFEIGEELRNHF
jgi:electron transfer flavoprotein alpha subunit